MTTSAQGIAHTFVWKASADIIKSANVVFRIRAISDEQRGPFLWSAGVATTPPFRLTSPWYIRVVNENGNPIADATVYANGQPITQVTVTASSALALPVVMTANAAAMQLNSARPNYWQSEESGLIQLTPQ